LDCPDCCSLSVTVEDGHAIKLRGDAAHPVTRGFLCGKVAQYLDRQYSPSRLLYPQRRIGKKGEGKFERIGWDEALDTIASGLAETAREFGPESVLPYSYAGTMGLLNGYGMASRFFHRLGASRLDRTICSAAGVAGLTEALGVRLGTEPEQFRHSRLILAWGANILGTNVHLWPFIMEARRNGAKLYTIDPRRNRTAAASDKHFFINPGSDTALALAVMHVIVGENLYDTDYVAAHTEGFPELRERVRGWTPARAAELTGIAAAEIASLAREYSTTRPAAIRLNYGVQRSERGAMAVRAVALLPALIGSWREVGGGLQLSTSQAFALNREGSERPDLQHIALGRPARLVNMAQLGSALTTLDNPPVHALVVYNSNPAAIAPDQNAVLRGLARSDLFTVVLEQFQTDTADYADILLPATTFLEHTDLYLAYGHYYLQLARPALAPSGEARSNQDVFRALAARMGFQEPCFAESDDDQIRGLLDSGHTSPNGSGSDVLQQPLPDGRGSVTGSHTSGNGHKDRRWSYVAGITLEELDRDHFVRLRLPEPFLPFANGGFGTADGKCHFRAESLAYEPPVESRHGDADLRRQFPLEMITPKGDDAMNSTFGNRDGVDRATATLHLAAADALSRGIRDGDRVRVFNRRGSCLLAARVDDTVRPGLVSAPSVRWAKRSPGGRSANALTSERLTDRGGGPTFYSCLVEVEKTGD
jgi:anaerobic selenocysteine-containing dehydrogenase